MKHSVKLFLEILKEATLEMQEDEPSKQFKKGVKETIKMAKVWFKDSGITELDVTQDEE